MNELFRDEHRERVRHEDGASPHEGEKRQSLAESRSSEGDLSKRAERESTVSQSSEGTLAGV